MTVIGNFINNQPLIVSKNNIIYYASDSSGILVFNTFSNKTLRFSTSLKPIFDIPIGNLLDEEVLTKMNKTFSEKELIDIFEVMLSEGVLEKRRKNKTEKGA